MVTPFVYYFVLTKRFKEIIYLLLIINLLFDFYFLWYIYLYGIILMYNLFYLLSLNILILLIIIKEMESILSKNMRDSNNFENTGLINIFHFLLVCIIINVSFIIVFYYYYKILYMFMNYFLNGIYGSFFYFLLRFTDFLMNKTENHRLKKFLFILTLFWFFCTVIYMSLFIDNLITLLFR